MRSFHWQLCLLACLSFAFTVGCQQDASEAEHAEESHEHEDAHAETLAEAITELTELHSEISAAFSSDKPDNAHDALHDVGHVIEEIAVFAKAEKLPEDRISAIESAIKNLMDGYGELDKSMHGGDGKPWSEVSAAIDEALKSLKAAAAGEIVPAAEPTAPAQETPAEEKPTEAAPADPAPAEGDPTEAQPAADASANPQ